MKRRIFNLLAAMSLLLCVASVVAWGLSYHFNPTIEGVFEREGDGTSPIDQDVELEIARGRLSIMLSRDMRFTWGKMPYKILPGRVTGFHGLSASIPIGDRNATTWRGVIEKLYQFGSSENTLGFTFHIVRSIYYFAPVWPLTILFAIAPSFRLIRRARRRLRTINQQCQECGYDLRATPERCPECGTATDAAMTKSE